MDGKEEVYYNGQTVIVDYNKNPWEFIGHFPNAPGVRFTFNWCEVNRKEAIPSD